MGTYTPPPMSLWAKRAACKDADPTLFDLDSIHPYHLAIQNKVYCNACPVEHECLMWGSVTGARGIWGGATYRQRNRMMRNLRYLGTQFQNPTDFLPLEAFLPKPVSPGLLEVEQPEEDLEELAKKLLANPLVIVRESNQTVIPEPIPPVFPEWEVEFEPEELPATDLPVFSSGPKLDLAL
jgi:hypothetical protein